ncbi:adenylate/guanylate cyclase domain-containing protein [Bradyrhizobium sp. CB1650]|uniref:adenylate/guanylate cyclase domain-containing protein n=1 Tax=Bradyrhizobium sp. CB1650 TaxID=3039153 RepID=UPI00243598E3|nr:adenylate/guanylate cyclase domain-containing protein [Bradyrhizobium sp. CB1650]WGD51562.1 adenylate/guanylate cyclase domain-containing protein [Bradyrhizobium sp. CB1650]
MLCERCRHQVPADAAFCPECGTKLEVICSHCGAGNAIAYKFCKRCGGPLESSKSPSLSEFTPRYLAEKIRSSKHFLAAERKRVTVLFADIKGSLELIVDRDPEDGRRLLDGVLELMIGAVHRYEGTVSHFMGDGIMALFGAPVAHEDHVVRACYAALLMQESIRKYSEELRRREGFQVLVRIGLNSGEVIVRAIRSDLSIDYTAVGQTAHLAARMEQIATPGSILITADVAQLADGYIESKSMGFVPVKGINSPVHVYELTGTGPVRTRLQAAAARGLTQFVGRSSEMQALRNALELTSKNRGQIVAVVGEAGVGKSRLLHEFTHSRHVQGWQVLATNTVSYGRATPYLPIIGFLKDYFNIDPREDFQTIREKVTGKVIGLDQSLQEAIPAVLDLLEVLPKNHPFATLDPVQRRREITLGFRRLMVRESRVKPLILLFEDLHWNDLLSIGLIDSLVEVLTDERILLLVSYRPDYQDDWRLRSHYREIDLRPFPSQAMEQLLEAVLGSEPALLNVRRPLIDRAEGNPFFLEEIVRMLVETGVLGGERGHYRLLKPFSDLQVPPHVQAVISSRIDRLAPELKSLLQEAAVVGKDVPFDLLTIVTKLSEQELRSRLAELQAGEFLYETKLFPELEFTFKHALTHEVTYESLTKERRCEIHSDVADSMERLYSERLSEHVERLAQHAFLGQVWPKALKYLREAGARAVERRANREATVRFKQALEALKHLPENRDFLQQSVDIRFDIRNALQPLGDLGQIGGYLDEAEELARRLGDQSRLGWVSAYLTEHFRMLGNPQSAAESGERSLAIGRSIGDMRMQVVTNIPMGLLYHALGQYRQAIEFLQWNVDNIGEELVHERFGLFGLPSVFSRAFLAYCFAELGDFRTGILVGEEGAQLADAEDHQFSKVYANLGIGYLLLRKGDLTRAIATLERALNLGQFAQIPVAFAYGASYLGYALTLVGRVDEGLPLLEQTTTETISTTFVARHSLRVAYLGEAYLASGRIEAAAAAAAWSLKLAQDHSERGHEAYALRLLGEVRCQDDPAEGEKHLSAALRMAQELGMRPLEAHCHSGLARLYYSKEDPRFEEHAVAATTLFQDMDMTLWLNRMAAELGARRSMDLSSLAR